MIAKWKCAALLAGLIFSIQANAAITFFERDGFGGRSFTTERSIADFARYGFNDRASSVDVQDERWEVCENAAFRGRCVILRPGRYPNLSAMGLNDRVSSVRMVGRKARIDERRYAPPPAVGRGDQLSGQITFYEHNDFQGRAFAAEEPVANFIRYGFNDLASSVVIRNGRWEVCEDVSFRGRCVVLQRGQYPSLGAMGLNDRISSATLVGREERDDRQYSPVRVPDQTPYRRAHNERLYEADVIAVHAVVGPPEKRCWVEREQVVQEHDNRVPGTVVGAVIGGILGHQIGDGRGQALATVGGAVAGAVVGNNLGRNSADQETVTRDVERCATGPNRAKPEFWDVSYAFGGVEHHLQMTTPPGRTITVNEHGEPRL